MMIRVEGINETTKCFARTLKGAFGPHTSTFVENETTPPKRPTRGQQMLKAAVIAVGTVAGTMGVLWLMAGGGGLL